jgi:hypothetical protein
MVSNDCRRRDCQLESGTGLGSHLTFARAGVTVTGEAVRWDMAGDSGAVKTRAFCPVCGSPVYMTFAAKPDAFTIRAASLDDPSRCRPQNGVLHPAQRTWDHLDPDLPKFERVPAT